MNSIAITAIVCGCISCILCAISAAINIAQFLANRTTNSGTRGDIDEPRYYLRQRD